MTILKKPWVSAVLKIVFAIGLVVYLSSKGLIDWAVVGDALTSWRGLVIGIPGLLLLNAVLALRWKCLAKAAGISGSFPGFFQIIMIANFFSTFLPGSVGADLAKGYYLMQREPKKKVASAFVVVLDRVMGLSALMLACSVSTLFSWEIVWSRAPLRILALATYAFSVISIVAFIGFYRGWDLKLFPWLPAKLKEGIALLRADKRYLIRSLFPVVLSPLVTISVYFLLGQQISAGVGWMQYCFIVPFALLVASIPLVPIGIGVGQVAFLNLFAWLGAPTPELGATLCTLLQSYMLVINLIGGAFYLIFSLRKKTTPALSEMPERRSA